MDILENREKNLYACSLSLQPKFMLSTDSLMPFVKFNSTAICTDAPPISIIPTVGCRENSTLLRVNLKELFLQ